MIKVPLMKIEKSKFGSLTDQTPVDLYTLSNDAQMPVKITNYGGIVTFITVPDKHGESGQVVLGFETLEPYLRTHPFFGALVGRYGNRIGKAQFELDGRIYPLAINKDPNHLHGGLVGFDKKLWKPKMIQESDFVGLELSYLSVDGEEGYPGNLDVTVTYKLTNDNELVIEYLATTDQPLLF